MAPLAKRQRSLGKLFMTDPGDGNPGFARGPCYRLADGEKIVASMAPHGSSAAFLRLAIANEIHRPAGSI